MTPQYLSKQLTHYRQSGGKGDRAQDSAYRMLSHMAGELRAPGIDIKGRLQQ